jgi:uncharacterized membrane-anchored protein YitT (DUF2179 family)
MLRTPQVQTIRDIVVLITGFLAGSRLVQALRSWQEWHRWDVQDPSGADAYRSFFLVNMAVAITSLMIAGLVWWLLRPKLRAGPTR